MKEKNIVLLLNDHSIHGRKVDRVISRSLLKTTNRHYKCTWQKNLCNGFSYDGNMYLGNETGNFCLFFQGCFTCQNEPHFLKTGIAQTNAANNVGTEASWRIKDTLMFECNVTRSGDAEGLRKGHYENCLYALTSSSYVIQYLIKPTGWKIVKVIYLGKFSFSHMNYDSQLDRFVVKSKHNPNSSDPDLRIYFALFTTAPFGFKAFFSVRKSVFGAIKDAFVINGLIVILSNDSYTFYSLDDVLKFSTRHVCDFGDTIAKQIHLEHSGNPTDSQIVGEYPYGLPVNLVINEKPLVLFQLSSKNITGLSFGGFPWFCLGTHYETSKLYRVSSGEHVTTLQHGKYAFATLDDEKKAYFHSDRSGRILCIEYDEIKCLKILDTSNDKDCVKFTTSFSIQYGNDIIKKYHPQAKRSKSGRLYKQVKRPDLSDLPPEIVHALDYDNTLDVLAVLHTCVKGKILDNTYAVTLYDNLNGDVIRTFDLDTEISDSDAYDWNIFFNDLMVICTLKRLGSNRTVDKVFTYLIHE